MLFHHNYYVLCVKKIYISLLAITYLMKTSNRLKIEKPTVRGFAFMLLFVFLLNIYVTVKAQPPPREQTLYVTIWGRVENPNNFNYYAPGAPYLSSNCMGQFVWEYLFYMNYETGEYIPWLAERFEYTPDYKSIIVYLRKGVKWSDGVPFTADDVVFTYNMHLKYAPKLLFSGTVAANVESVEKIDDYTVKINLKSPNPRFHLNRDAFPAVLVSRGLTIVPKHIWEKVNPLNFTNNPPVATGPYRVVSASPTAFLLERRDDWWATELFGIRPGPKYVVCKYYGPEESLAAALAANEVDAIYIGMISFGTVKTVQEKNPYAIIWSKAPPYAWIDPGVRVLMVNNQKYPFSLPEVRHALSYILNRELISRLVFDNTAPPTVYIHPEYGTMKPYLDSIKDLVEKYEIGKYDPAKAEQIFKNLGFKKGPDGIWVTPNGTRVQAVYIYHTADDPVEQRKAMEVITQMLRSFGIDVIAKGLEGPTFENTMNSGDWTLRYGFMTPGDSDPFFNLYLSHSKFAAPPGQPVSNWQWNGWRYINPEYDKIVDELMMTSPLDQEKAISLFRKAMDIFYRDLPVIPLVQAPAVVPFSSYYWTGWPTSDNPWIQPTPWWNSFSRVVTGYPSPKTGEWVGGIKPTKIDYATVYFVKDTPKFRGIDLIWYGPFKAGDAARIPADDAEFWIKKGYASFTPPAPTAPAAPNIQPLVNQVAENSKKIDELKGNIDNLVAQLSGLAMLIQVNIVLTLIVLAVMAYIVLKKK
jgi:peptide/nickel transport system substrate-binding protein